MGKSHIDILLDGAVYTLNIEGSVEKKKCYKPIATLSDGWLLMAELPRKGHQISALHIQRN